MDTNPDLCKAVKSSQNIIYVQNSCFTVSDSNKHLYITKQYLVLKKLTMYSAASVLKVQLLWIPVYNKAVSSQNTNNVNQIFGNNI